jgi:putative phosphoesterase
MKIAILSDTHSWLDDRILEYLKNADEIWHAGDIGSIEVIDRLEQLPGNLRAVSGNIDNQQIQLVAPEVQAFNVENNSVIITHIAGNPPKYNSKVRQLLHDHHPDILVCGHSHILKVMHDKRSDLLFINPGSCSHHGFHKMRTLIQFQIINGKPQKMIVIELGKRGKTN